MEKLELRMYSLVLYQLSGIQAGIQSGHANIEYGVKYNYPEEYKEWAKDWKTVIVLNGGSSIALTEKIKELDEAGIKYCTFVEPDLYGQVSAVSFIIDERVFNKTKYPDFIEIDVSEKNNMSPNCTQALSLFRFNNWGKSIGGKENIWLREWLNLNRFKYAG